MTKDAAKAWHVRMTDDTKVRLDKLTEDLGLKQAETLVLVLRLAYSYLYPAFPFDAEQETLVKAQPSAEDDPEGEAEWEAEVARIKGETEIGGYRWTLPTGKPVNIPERTDSLEKVKARLEAYGKIKQAADINAEGNFEELLLEQLNRIATQLINEALRKQLYYQRGKQMHYMKCVYRFNNAPNEIVFIRFQAKDTNPARYVQQVVDFGEKNLKTNAEVIGGSYESHTREIPDVPYLDLVVREL